MKRILNWLIKPMSERDLALTNKIEEFFSKFQDWLFRLFWTFAFCTLVLAAFWGFSAQYIILKAWVLDDSVSLNQMKIELSGQMQNFGYAGILVGVAAYIYKSFLKK